MLETLPRRAVVVAAATLGVAAGVLAQTTDVPTGLDAVDEAATLSTIVELGLEDLLRHSLAKEGVAEQDAEIYLANLALSRLTGDAPVPTAQRQALVLDIAAGVDGTVARHVPERQAAQVAEQLLGQASVLIDRGIGEEVRLLEYFGDNPERRRYVGTVAEAVGKLLRRSAELYDAEAERLEATIVRADQPEVQQAAAASRSAEQARSLVVFADYYRVLGTDPDAPARINLADDVAKRLARLDTERNPNRAFVQLMLAKVNLARGNETGEQQARDLFEAAIDGLGEEGADPGRLFDAYFGRSVAEAELGNADAAREQLERLNKWFAAQSADLPGRDALLLVAAYRVASADARNADTAAARDEAEQRATDLLTSLVAQFEGYRPIVTGQLLDRAGETGDLAELSPLLLDAMVDRGRAEAARAASASSGDTERPTIEQGVAAAEELLRRLAAGNAEVDPVLVARNAFVAALMKRTLGDEVGAAELFARFGELPSADRERRLTAYRQAAAIAEQLKADGGDAAVRADAVEATVVPVLVDEYGEDQLAFDLALRRHKAGELNEAIGYYTQVPADDPRKPSAEQFRFLALAERASELEPGDATYREALAEAVEQGDAALAAVTAAAEGAQSGPARDAYRGRAADTRVALARLALNEQADPERATQLLADVERQVEGLSEAESILQSALPLRFQAQAISGDVDGATGDLLALLDRSEPARGFAYIEQFREALGRAYDAAVRRGDEEQRRSLTLTRAAVTPRLVDWIEGSDDPAYRKYAYTFRTLDAETQYQAAREETDAAARERRLRVALDRYRQLAEASSVREFRQLIEGITDAQRETVQYDPDVLLNQGRILYELGEYAAARDAFGRLLADRTLGEPTRQTSEGGVVRNEANDEFWEAQLRYVQSSLAADASSRDAMARLLRRLDALHGDAVGGTRWQDEFAALRGELLG